MFGGDIMIITNPMYPLKFERFGPADIAKDPEFQARIETLNNIGSPVPCEMSAMANAYGSKRIYKAEGKRESVIWPKILFKEPRKLWLFHRIVLKHIMLWQCLVLIVIQRRLVRIDELNILVYKVK